MSPVPRKIKKAMAKWQCGQTLGLQESRRVRALLLRTRLSRKLKKHLGAQLLRGNGTSDP